MNERKWKQLLTAARNEPAPAPPEDFATGVLQAIRREERAEVPATFPVLDQLNLWFPRLTWAAAAIIALCIAADLGLTAAGLPGLGDGAAQISEQWFLTPNGF